MPCATAFFVREHAWETRLGNRSGNGLEFVFYFFYFEFFFVFFFLLFLAQGSACSLVAPQVPRTPPRSCTFSCLFGCLALHAARIRSSSLGGVGIARDTLHSLWDGSQSPMTTLYIYVALFYDTLSSCCSSLGQLRWQYFVWCMSECVCPCLTGVLVCLYACLFSLVGWLVGFGWLIGPLVA